MWAIDEPLVGQLFEYAVTRSGAVGAQLSLVKGGQQVDLAAGLADARHGTPMTTATLTQVGSITKVFNATLVLSLVDEGLLALDEPVERYVPVPLAEPDARRELTLRHLLSMSSGLDNGPYVYFGRGDDALAAYVTRLAKLPRHFPPGRHFGYSNAGACVAGWIASRATGMTWERLLRERVLTPAGLEHAAITDADVGDRIVSVGHIVDGDGQPPRTVEPLFTDLRARAPSGPSFALSTAGLARFGARLGRGTAGDGATRLLSPGSAAEMHAPQIATPTRKYGKEWCLGPCSDVWDGQAVWGHGGTSPTATSYLYWLPGQQGAIAFMTNTHAAMGELSRIVFDDVCRAAFGCAKPRIDVPDPGAGAVEVGRYVGRYEELGMTMEVSSGEPGTLRARLTPEPIVGETGVTRIGQDATLRPLGGDRFLMDPVDGPDRHRGIVDTAFFGRDAHGRATNALNLVFPMSRGRL